MGFFSLFKKKEKRVLKIGEVSGFLEEYVASLHLDKEFSALTHQIRDQKQGVMDSLGELDNAELMNKNVPPRALSMLRGNKQAYIQRMGRFIHDILPPKDLLETEDFLKSLSKQMDEFSKNTQKNYMVISEFHKDELFRVTRGVKEIEKAAQDFIKKTKKYRLDEIEKIRQILAELEESKKERSLLKKRIREAEEKKKEAEQQIQILEGELNDLKASPEHKRFISTREALAKKEMEMGGVKHEIQQPFSEILRAMRKYKRGSLDEDLIDRYQENAVKGLEADGELKILRVLEKLEQELPNLELKNEDRIRHVLSTITKEFLESRMNTLKNLEEEAAELKNHLSQNHIQEQIEEKHDLLKEKRKALADMLVRTENKPKSDDNKLLQEMSELLDSFDVQLQ